MPSLYGLATITPPAIEPVTLAEARDQLWLPQDDRDQDVWLIRNITVARALCENLMARQFITATYSLTLDSFPHTAPFYGGVGEPYYYSTRWDGYETVIYIPKPPLQSVASIQYLDTTGTLQTWPTNQYIVDPLQEPGRITPAYGIPWEIPESVIKSVTVQFTCGYGSTAASVPATIRQAILLVLARLYRFRGDDDGEIEIPEAAKQLLLSESWGWYR